MTFPGDDVDSGDELPLLPGFREMAQRRRQMLTELAAQRRRAGLSQAEVAARMGTSQPAVARLEAGMVDARLSTLERYAAAVGCQLEMRIRTTDPDRRSGVAEVEAT